MIYQGRAKYPVHEVCLHTTATPKGWMHGRPVVDIINTIRHWHVHDNGWRDIGYHYVISRTGEVGFGRDETDIGAGVAGHNRGVIHIALVGGRGGSADDRFEDHYTSAQELALRALLREISERTEIRKISGHNEYAAKACPCFRVRTEDWMPKVPPNPQSFWARLAAMLT